MKNKWLADIENTDQIYTISKKILAKLAPHESLVFDEIFPRYMELAQKGKVTTAKQAAREFSLSGDEVFLTFIILQALTRVLELLLKENNSSSLEHLYYQIDPQLLLTLLEEALKKERQTYAVRQQVKQPIAQAILNELGDVYMPYENGLKRLLAELGQEDSRYLEALTYQQKLTENINQTRSSGDTETRRAERTQVIEQLNRLALSELERSFNEFVYQQGEHQKPKPYSSLSEEPAISLPPKSFNRPMMVSALAILVAVLLISFYTMLYLNDDSQNHSPPGTQLVVSDLGGRHQLKVDDYIRTSDICVRKGNDIEVRASGQITVGEFVGQVSPEGKETFEILGILAPHRSQV